MHWNPNLWVWSDRSGQNLTFLKVECWGFSTTPTFLPSQTISIRPVAGQGGPWVRTPPEICRILFLNRVNQLTFYREGGTHLLPSPYEKPTGLSAVCNSSTVRWTCSTVAVQYKTNCMYFNFFLNVTLRAGTANRTPDWDSMYRACKRKARFISEIFF